MKSFLNFIFLSFTSFGVFAQVIGVENINVSGDNDKRINIVVMGDGYTSSEQDKFITDVNNIFDAFFNASPFKEYEAYFNIYAIKVVSNESGADHPNNASDESFYNVPEQYVDTFFNATFDAYGIHRLLYYEIDANGSNNTEVKINDVLANNFPNYDVALILVNTPYYGGTGGSFPMSPTHSKWGSQMVIHELSHTLFELKDEYYPGDDLAAEAINMTQESDPLKVKWKNWIGINNVNTHQHTGSGNASSWYKPAKGTCIMEAINKNYCSVCIEGVIEKIHDLISPIETYSPDSNTIENPTLPLEFNLSLIKPIPNTLESTWTLNSSTFSENTDNISLTEDDLEEGSNTLTVVVHDNASLLKVDNHTTESHVYTVTWSIDYSTLGIENITSTKNEFNISLYPNPTNNLIKLNVISDNTKTIKVDIVSMDGKVVKTTNIVNIENQTLDISDLSQGIYLANFYAQNTLISSKRLVKN